MILFRQIWSHNLHQRPSFAGTFFSPSLILTVERRSRLTRLDPETGIPVWEAKIHNPWGWLTATDTSAFYLNQHTILQCFAAGTGQLTWENALTGWNYFGYLVAVERYLLVGGWRGYTPFQCLNAKTGELLWTHPEKADFGLPVPGVWGVALPDIASRELTIVDWATGQIMQRLSLPIGVQVGERSSSLQRYRDGLIVTTENGRIYLLDPTTETSWQQIGAHDEGIVTITPAILGRDLIFQDRERHLCCYDIDRRNLKWSRKVIPPHLEHFGFRIAATMISQERLIVGTSIGRLEVLNPEGDRIGAHTIGKPVATDLCAVENDEVIFGTAGLIVRYSIQ
jgi:outer membrane protein assembly factor BamB